MKPSLGRVVVIGALVVPIVAVPSWALATLTPSPTRTATPCPTGTPCGGEFEKQCPPGALAGDSCLCTCEPCPTCPAGESRACDMYECGCECHTFTPTPTPTACETFPASQLTFQLSVEPAHPAVGDVVQLTFTVSGRGGIPAYTLAGAPPVFRGDTSIITSNQLGAVVYHLTAAQAGTTMLALSVNYETSIGCIEQPIFEFVTETSPTFNVVVTAQGATPTPTPTIGLTPPPSVASCVGDCGGNGQVTVEELVAMVNVALGDAELSTCAAGDANRDNRITIDEVVVAVNNALADCHVVGVGAQCDGFVSTPMTCAPGLLCQLSPLPDAGGVCVLGSL